MHPSIKPSSAWKFKATASLADQTPVLNTWYTVLDTTTAGVRISMVQVKQANGEAAAKTLEVKFTLDGESISDSASLNNNTVYYVNLERDMSASLTFGTASKLAGFEGLESLFAHSAKVETRTTSALGTAPLLNARINYYLWRPA